MMQASIPQREARSVSAEVSVLGTGLFLPSEPDEDNGVEPSGAMLHPRQRRRASPFTRALVDAYAEALTQASAKTEGRPANQLPARTELATVFGSALGEANTMIGLLDQMWRGDGTLSPMRFVTSVHNTAAGIVSITEKNQGFTTSLGADFDTPAMALAEAVGLVLASQQTVVVCCGDDSVPEHLIAGGEGWGMLAGAVVLAPAANDTAPGVRLSLNLRAGGPRPESELPPHALPGHLARNPCAGIVDLIQAISLKKRGSLRLDRGAGLGFQALLRVQ